MKSTGKNIIAAGLLIIAAVVGFFALKFVLKAIAFSCKVVFHSWWTLLLFGMILVLAGSKIMTIAKRNDKAKLTER